MERKPLVDRLDKKAVLKKKTTKTTNRNVVDKLPDKLLLPILARLDLQPLILIRGVSKRWQKLIEDFCQDRTSIVVKGKGSDTDMDWVSEQFNGLVDFSANCAILAVNEDRSNVDESKLYKNLCIFISSLFSRIEHFVVKLSLCQILNSTYFLRILKKWSPTLTTLLLPRASVYSLDDLSYRIHRLPHLKRLYFDHLYTLNKSTIGQLEHCCFNEYTLSDVVPKLSSRCTSLYLWEYTSSEDITRITQLNPSLAAGLTRLKISIDDFSLALPVVSLVCDKFAALEMLSIRFIGGGGYIGGDVLGQISRINELKSLTLDCVYINLDDWYRSKVTLESVQTLGLIRFHTQEDEEDDLFGPHFGSVLFCIVVSSIVPNLRNLIVKHKDPIVRQGVTRHLHHFDNLLKHEIASVEDAFVSYDLGC